MLPLFCLTSQLQRPVKNFLSVKYICLRYLKCSPTSGLSNAPTLDVLRHVEMILKHFGGFSNNPPKFQKKPNSPFKDFNLKTYEKNRNCGFVGNIKVDSGLTYFLYRATFGHSRHQLLFENGSKSRKYGKF